MTPIESTPSAGGPAEAPASRWIGGRQAAPSFDLRPEMPAELALRAILRVQLETLLVNEPGLRLELDPEFLHGFRVAIRRSRSALTQLGGILPTERAAHLRAELSWLGEATNAKRDSDVYRLKLPGYRAELPEHVRADLEPLAAFLHERDRAAQAQVLAALDSERYRALLAAWRALVAGASEAADAPPDAARPILEVANERIWPSYQGLVRKARKVGPDAPPERLHRVRIAGKKLRYLLEFFRGLYPETEIAPLVSGLRKLQDSLGDFNDYAVQRHALRHLAEDMFETRRGTVALYMAMGRLTEHLELSEARERRRCVKRLQVFDSGAKRKRFRALFAPSASGAEGTEPELQEAEETEPELRESEVSMHESPAPLVAVPDAAPLVAVPDAAPLAAASDAAGERPFDGPGGASGWREVREVLERPADGPGIQIEAHSEGGGDAGLGAPLVEDR